MVNKVTCSEYKVGEKGGKEELGADPELPEGLRVLLKECLKPAFLLRVLLI